MNEITPSRNGQDQYYNKWERLFKGSSNYQEEQQEASSEQAPAELNPWEKMAQEVLDEQPHTTDTAYEKAENVEKGAESEKIEEAVPEENLEKYFETMDGEALSFLKASFSGSEEAKRQEEAEKAIKKERFEAELEEVKAQIKRARGNIEDDLEVLDRAERELDRLLEDHSADNDTDFLRSKVKQMGYAIEDLDHDNRRFAHANSDYGDMVTDGKESEFFDEERVENEKRQVLDNEDYSYMTINRKIRDTEDKIDKLRRKIAILDNENGAHRYRGW